jgi:hypothetical protein
MCEVYVKVAGNWEQVNEIYVKVGGTWQLLTEAWHRVDNAWRIFWQPNGFVPFTQMLYEPTQDPILFGISGEVFAPCGATSVTVYGWGAGGAGGAKDSSSGTNLLAGSGGGAQYNIMGSYPVTPLQRYGFYLGGPSSFGVLNPPNPTHAFTLDSWGCGNRGDPATLATDFSATPYFAFIANGGEGGTSVWDNVGGDVLFDPGNPGNGGPAVPGPPSGFGGTAGGPGGGAGGQSIGNIPPQFPGGGGAGGYNGAPGQAGISAVLYLSWS